MTHNKVNFGTITHRALPSTGVKTAVGRGKAARSSVRASGRIKAAIRRCLATVAVLSVTQFLQAAPAEASPTVGYDEAPLVVMNDNGGLLRDRLRQIAKLRKQGRPIEIRGGVCYSTCTMLMGLPNACISPKTVFGFHGPSSYGRSLDQASFERASAVIASYYPEPLQDWYMSDARYTIKGVRRVRGDNIIDMGVASC